MLPSIDRARESNNRSSVNRRTPLILAIVLSHMIDDKDL